MSERFDLAVVGAGIVGLTAARAIGARRPDWSIAVIEKESGVGAHQTGRNSGVVHSGAYYVPGSLKARLCREGRESLLRYAETNRIAHRRIGKLIVARGPHELPGLATIESRARANGVGGVRALDGKALKDRLPGVSGVAGLEIPTAEIIDYPAVAERLAAELRAAGHAILTDRPVARADAAPGGWRFWAGGSPLEATRVVNCAGLGADRLAEVMGTRPSVRIVPFRGDFYRLSARIARDVPCLVYPVPDPDVPFLGVHLTPTVHGELLAGPNAALALAREGYRPGEWELRELWGMAGFAGTIGLARRYGRLAAREWLRSWSPGEFLSAIRTVWPGVDRTDLGARTSGVRAQAVRPDGTMEDDFVFVRGERALHVLNAPSPAATAAFAIAERIADELLGSSVVPSGEAGSDRPPPL